MYKFTLFLLAAALYVSVAATQAQYYVPSAYYTIDAEGHESVRVPLRRLRRSLNPYPYAAAANANANADAIAEGWGADANANANARAHAGAWGLPVGASGATNHALSSGMTRRQYGPTVGRSVSASTSVTMDASGHGYYDQTASVH